MVTLTQALSAIADALGLRDGGPSARPRRIGPDEPPRLLVKAKVHDVLRRGVPVNRIEPGPAVHTARVVFADGSIALIQSVPPGHLMDAAVACLRTRVTAHPSPASDDGDILLTWRRGQVLVELIGPDQPD
ncbi:MAG TPA: hypothetical protein VFK68_02860 [Propionibacteriaceae bacterium]|nr:hypothetical protein [Propionibacteriaceae bacterium]